MQSSRGSDDSPGDRDERGRQQEGKPKGEELRLRGAHQEAAEESQARPDYQVKEQAAASTAARQGIPRASARSRDVTRSSGHASAAGRLGT